MAVPVVVHVFLFVMQCVGKQKKTNEFHKTVCTNAWACGVVERTAAHTSRCAAHRLCSPAHMLVLTLAITMLILVAVVLLVVWCNEGNALLLCRTGRRQCCAVGGPEGRNKVAHAAPHTHKHVPQTHGKDAGREGKTERESVTQKKKNTKTTKNGN